MKTVETLVEVPGMSVDCLPWQAEEYNFLRKTIREFARNEIAPRIAEMEHSHNIPPELFREIGTRTFLGAPFAEKYGGSDFGEVGAAIVMEELNAVHASVATMVGAHVWLACGVLSRFGSEDQKQRYLVPAIRGEYIGAFAITEDKVGSDVAGIRTVATPTYGGHLLHGSKRLITNGDIAHFVIAFAQTGTVGDQNTIAAFIVETASKGFAAGKPEEKMGLHASHTCSVMLDDVFVPDANRIPGNGFRVAMETFNHSRIGLAAGCLGVIRAALDEAIAFVRDRSAFGKRIWEFQAIQNDLAEIEMYRYALEPAVYQTAWLADRGQDIRYKAASIKYLLSEIAGRLADMALQIHGGDGYIRGNIERIVRDARVTRIYEGTSQMMRLMVARHLIESRIQSH